jgi:hypothetical protein
MSHIYASGTLKRFLDARAKGASDEELRALKRRRGGAQQG